MIGARNGVARSPSGMHETVVPGGPGAKRRDSARGDALQHGSLGQSAPDDQGTIRNKTVLQQEPDHHGEFAMIEPHVPGNRHR